MTTNYKYGFDYKRFSFGWKNKELHRLPSVLSYDNGDIKSFPLKKLPLIDVGNKKGYRIVKDRKTIDQLMEMTEVINYTHTVNGKQSEDTPF